MATTGLFVDHRDVRAYLGAENFERVFHDFEEKTPNPVQLIIDAGEAEVFAAAVSTYPAANLPGTPAAARLTQGGKLLRNIALWCIKAEALERYPEISRDDPEPIRKRADSMVQKLRDAKIVLHGINVDPANVGGDVYPDDPSLDEPEKFFTDSGIF